MLLQAFARPEDLVDKVGVFVPALAQQESSKSWIDNWISSNMKILMNTRYLDLGLANNKLHIYGTYDADTNEAKYGSGGKSLKDNNTFTILQNIKGELLVENKHVDLTEIKKFAKSFLIGKNLLSEESPDSRMVNLSFIGDTEIPQVAIVYRKDIATPKEDSEALLIEIGESIVEARDEMAKRYFQNSYFLLPPNKQNVINEIIPAQLIYVYPKVVKESGPPPKVEKILKTK
jgi:hypothetical protein